MSRRILVVDDEKGFRDMLDWSLCGDGISVETAVDGRDAEGKIARERYALVITDISMPRMDGLKLLRVVRRSSPETPVILMTGFGTVETAVEAMKEGAADFVLKPFDMELMLARVRRLLGLGEKTGAGSRSSGEKDHVQDTHR
jgi:DNA-binding NtrC family response regulator